MTSRSVRLSALALAIVVFYFAVALLYQVGMAALEGEQRTFLEAFSWAAETVSTTGYGADARWSHPLMIAFIAVVQFIGMFLAPLFLALFLMPYFAERFEQRVPRQAGPKMTKHVIVYGFGPNVETLLARLNGSGVKTLVVETDELRARTVMEQGQQVVFSRSEEDALDVARLRSARALVANGADQENAALVLRARQMGFAGDIFAFVEDPSHRKPMELAGATSVYTPRHIVAAALAAHASDRLSPRLPGLESIEGLERRELRVPARSPIAGRSLRDARLPAVVVGIWNRSHLHTRCSPDTVLEPGCVIELVGTPEALAESAAVASSGLLHNSGAFLIAGFGEVGRKVHELLRDLDEEVLVIERQPGTNVDVAGDVLDTSVLQRAGLAEARALILALDSDDSTLFATVIARDVADDVPIIARVNHARNLDNMHRAGADYALSIADVSGQMLTSRLLGRDARVREEHRRIVRMEGWKLGGRTPAGVATADGRAVVALERGGRLLHRVEPDLPIEPDDLVWICGV